MPRAARDLSTIYRYLAKDNPDAARQLRSRLLSSTNILSDLPELGRMVPEYNVPEVRELIRTPYRIFYEIDETTRTIQILRFWHAARGEPTI